MNGQVFDLVEADQFLGLALVAGLDIAQHLQIAEPDPSFKQSPKDVVFLIEGKIDDVRVIAVGMEL